MTIESNKLDLKAVKEVVGKLPIEYVEILLIDCNLNCNFLPPNDASTDKKKLKIHREKLVNAIVDGNKIDIFTEAEDYAKSIDIHDEKIDPKQKELKKINAKAKEIREEIKELNYIKQKDIKKKAQERIETLGEEKSQRLAQYYSEREKARAELYRAKEKEKGLKAHFKAIVISIVDKMEGRYTEAAQEVKSSAVEFAEKYYSQIKQDPDVDVNLNTEEGMKLIDANLNKASELLVTKAIVKSKLDWEHQSSPIMSSLSTRAVKSKPQTVSVGV